MKAIAGKLSWFTATMLTNASLGLLVIPILVSKAGPQVWGFIAVGQSVGSIATVLVALGWGYNGPSKVARSTPADQRSIAINSVLARWLIAPIIIIPASMIAGLIAGAYAGVSAVACVSVCLGGLGMAWFFVGQGRPARMFFVDGVPRWAGTLAGAGLLLADARVEAFLTAQLIGAVLSALLGCLVAAASGPRVRRASIGLRPAFRSVREQAWAGATVITATSFGSAPTLIVAMLSPTSVPVYALGERLVRFAIMLVTPALQWTQGWAPGDSVSFPRRKRMQFVVKAAIATAVPMGAGVAILGPVAGDILSAGRITLPYALTATLGVVVACSIVSRVIGMTCLLALGRDRAVAVSSLLGAAIGTSLMFILTSDLGAMGAAVGLAVAELVVVGYQAQALRAAWAKR